MSKISIINLYSSDAPNELGLQLNSTDSVSQITSVNDLEIQAQNIKIIHSTDSTKNIDDLHTLLNSFSTDLNLQTTNTNVSSNATAINALDTRLQVVEPKSDIVKAKVNSIINYLNTTFAINMSLIP